MAGLAVSQGGASFCLHTGALHIGSHSIETDAMMLHCFDTRPRHINVSDVFIQVISRDLHPTLFQSEEHQDGIQK